MRRIFNLFLFQVPIHPGKELSGGLLHPDIFSELLPIEDGLIDRDTLEPSIKHIGQPSLAQRFYVLLDQLGVSLGNDREPLMHVDRRRAFTYPEVAADHL